MAFMTRERGPLPPVILLIAIIAEVCLHKWAPVMTLIPAPYHWAGVLGIVAGIVIVAGPVRDFRRTDTTIIPFKESSQLIVTGMYQVTRNPMYLGMLTILTGIAVLTGSLSPFIVPVLFVPVLYRRVIRHEEVMLEERFGDDYRHYKTQVRRWI